MVWFNNKPEYNKSLDIKIFTLEFFRSCVDFWRWSQFKYEIEQRALSWLFLPKCTQITPQLQLVLRTGPPVQFVLEFSSWQ